MKIFFVALLTLVCAHVSFAQQADDLTVTLPTGKVITFQTPEQKAKYLAVLARARQTSASQTTTIAVPVSASKASPLPLIALDAVNQRSGRNEDYSWRTDYGSYDATFQQYVGVDVGLRNMSPAPASVNLRWIFFARDNHSNTRIVFAASGKRFDLAAGQAAHFFVDSPLMEHHDTNYAALGEKYLEGSRYEGWLVQVMPIDGDEVIKQIASSSYLEDFAKNADFTALIADYRKKLQAH